MGEGGAHVCAFEGTLGGTDFDEFGLGEDYAAGAVVADSVAVFGVAGLWEVRERQLCGGGQGRRKRVVLVYMLMDWDDLGKYLLRTLCQ